MIKQLPRILVVVSIAALALLPWLTVGADSSGDWTQYLGSSARTGFNAAETVITPANASQLELQWSAKAGSLISAQPVTSQGEIFWGSWDGYERSTNLDGTLNWQTYLGQSSDVCDTVHYGVTDSPVVSTISVNGTPTRVLIVGGGDDNEYALNAATGTVIWKTALSPNAGSFTWSSPTLYNGSVYVGVSSTSDCPQVAGRLVKLDATTGAIQAVFNTVPQPPNVCKGGSIWTSPTIDTNTGIVYLAVGDTADCNDSSGNHIFEPLSQALVEVQASDLSLVNHWQVPYSSTIGDGDMTTTPTLFTATLNGVAKQMVGLFNKNGYYYAFDTTSNINSVGPVWTSQIAQTGQPDDGVSSVSSSAWDGQKLYLAGGATTIGGASCAGSIRAVDPSTGAFLWQDCLNTGEASAPVYGAVMASPGIVVVVDGDMLRVVRTSDGTQLFSYTDTSADFNGPATISNGVIYIGDEAGNLLAFTPSTTTPTVTPSATPTSVVALTGTHMAALPGANQSSVTQYAAKTKVAYFDYDVVTPAAQDSAEVKVLAGGLSGKVVASSNVLVGIQGPDYAGLQLAKGSWPDGGYCTVLYVNGIPQTLSGKLPIGWSVGASSTPSCGAKLAPQLHASVSGTLRIHHSATLTIRVKSRHKPQAQTTVLLDGRSVGIKKVKQAKTNKSGNARFTGLVAKKKGSIVITASKSGYRAATVKISAQ